MSRSSNTFPVTRPQHPRKRRETQVGAGIGSRCDAGCWGLKRFQVCVQLYTPEIHNRKVKPVPTCSEEQGLRGKDSVFLQERKVLAVFVTSTTPKRTVWLAQGKDGEDLALLQHFSSGSLETLSKAAGWRGLCVIAAGWGYSSAPTPRCHRLPYPADLMSTLVNTDANECPGDSGVTE